MGAGKTNARNETRTASWFPPPMADSSRQALPASARGVAPREFLRDLSGRDAKRSLDRLGDRLVVERKPAVPRISSPTTPPTILSTAPARSFTQPKSSAVSLGRIDELESRNLRPSSSRIPKLGVLIKPATLFKFRKALVDRKYHLLFSSSSHRRKAGPKGPSAELIATIVEMKRRSTLIGYSSGTPRTR